MSWTQNDIPNLTGKVVIVTGANSGLGLESAKALARNGATVVMAVRDLQKGEQARAEIMQAAPGVAPVPGAQLDLMQLDVGSLAAVAAFASAFKAKYGRLDILMNNAGVMAIPRQETVDGFEMQLATNHLGHFALTGLLIDLLVKTPKARIHTVSSTANFMGRINFDDLMGKQHYGRWEAYGQSKLANVFFAFELHKRLAAAGCDTIANVSHPGLVLGHLQTNSVAQSDTSSSEAIFYRILGPILGQDVSHGAIPMLYAATAPEAKGGVLYGPKWFYHRGGPAETRANGKAYDAAALKRFWEVSEQLTGVTYDILDRTRTS
jgi:protochlorophyllide reductase